MSIPDRHPDGSTSSPRRLVEGERRRRKLLAALKPQVDAANLSTVCDKRELELPLGLLKLNIPKAALLLLSDLVAKTTKGVRRTVNKGVE